MMAWRSHESVVVAAHNPKGGGMPSQTHIRLAATLLAVSMTLEVTLLAGINSIPDPLYHGLHLLFMAGVIASQLTLYWRSRGRPQARLALWFGAGMLLTAAGDYINGALSSVQPVSLKLTWALFLFGAGYILYNLALWTHCNGQLRRQQSGFARRRHLVAIPVLAVNVASWFLHVKANLTGMDTLLYGSFIFNATIYVMMPTLGFWYFLASRQGIGGLVVLIGTILVPYSDLVLFGSWLRGGDPAVPSFQLYACNWILYFGGQALLSLFPALVLAAPDDTVTITGQPS